MFPNLYGAMAMKRLTQKQLAMRLGMAPKTMGEKLRGVTEFKLSEMRAIQQIFGGSLEELFSQEEHSHDTV